MTENQWPQTTPVGSADEYPNTGTLPSGGTADSPSTTGTAKDEASAVAGHAAGEVKNVAGTAKAEAANVATEAKTSALGLMQQAKADLTDQAGTQQQKAAEGIRAVSSQLRTMAEASAQPGVATDLVRQAAERSQSAPWNIPHDCGRRWTARRPAGTKPAGRCAGHAAVAFETRSPVIPGSGTSPPGDGYRRGIGRPVLRRTGPSRHGGSRIDPDAAVRHGSRYHPEGRSFLS